MPETGDLLPDPGWIEGVSQTIHQFGAAAAGVLFIAIAVAIFALTFSQRGGKAVVCGVASAICLTIGGGFLVATVYIDRVDENVDLRFLTIQNVPVSATIQPISHDAYVNPRHSPSSCIRDFDLVWIKEADDEALRFRIVPLIYGPIDAKDACNKYAFGYEDIDFSYAMRVKLILRGRNNHFLYRHNDRRLIKDGPNEEHEILAPSEVFTDARVQRDSQSQWSWFRIVDSALAEEPESESAPTPFGNVLFLFSSGDFGEIWSGVSQLLSHYEVYKENIFSALISADLNEYQELGLLLTIRKHFKGLLASGDQIPTYSSEFVDSLVRLAASSNKIVSANARILLRSQPSASVVARFNDKFAASQDAKTKERLAGTGADLMYNFAVANALVASPVTVELVDDPGKVEEGIDALTKGWSYRKWGGNDDKFLFLKTLYGKALILGLQAAKASEEASASMPSKANKLQSTLEETFDEFVRGVQEIRASYPYPHHIEIAERCRPSKLPRAEAFEKCIADRQPPS